MGQEFSKTDETVLRSSQRSKSEIQNLRETSQSTPVLSDYKPKHTHPLLISKHYSTQSNPSLIDYNSPKFNHPLQEARSYSTQSNPSLLTYTSKYSHPLQESRYHVTQSNPTLLDFKAKSIHPLFESRTQTSQSFGSISDYNSSQSNVSTIESRTSSQSNQSLIDSRPQSSQSNQSLIDSRPQSSQSNHSFLDRFSNFRQSHLRHSTSLPDILSAGTNRKPRILMLGLDGAGKSGLFQSMRDKKSREQTHAPLTPTVAYNVTSLQVEGRACSLWDVSGRPLTRDLWKHYLSGADCLIWVVDSGDADRMEESRALLHKMVAHRALQGVPLLVVANKQDILTAVRPSQLEELLQLDTIRESGHLVKVVPSSATSRKDTRKLLKKLKKLLQTKNSNDSNQEYI